MSRLKKALAEKDLKGKQVTPKTTKAKTHEEVVAGNTTVNKAITAYHKATTLEVNALAMKSEAVKVISEYGVTRMFERQNTQNITLLGKEGDVYVCLKDQYTVKVNEETEKCDELEAFLEEKGVAPDSVVTYEEKASLDIKKMTDKEVDKLVDMLAKTFGQERMDEIFSVKTTPVINGLVAMFPTLCETQEEWTKLSTLAKQHRPTVNIPSKKGKK
jgi:hypothetical protein